MEIIRMKLSRNEKGLFIRVLPDEALTLIQSLAAQMIKKEPNSERHEFYAQDGTLFTVGVHQHLSLQEKETPHE